MSSFWNDTADDIFDLPPADDPSGPPPDVPAADDPLSKESDRMFNVILDQGSEIKPIQPHIRLIRYYEIATDLAKKAAQHEARWKRSQDPNDLQTAYIYLLRAVQYVIVAIPKHPQYNTPEMAMDKKIFSQHATSYMNKLEILQPAVQAWCRDTAQQMHDANAAQLAAQQAAALKAAALLEPPPPPPDEPYPEPPHVVAARVQAAREAEIARGITEGRKVLYKPKLQVVTIVRVHLDDEMPYYTVTSEDGEERQTTGDKLEALRAEVSQPDTAPDALMDPIAVSRGTNGLPSSLLGAAPAALAAGGLLLNSALPAGRPPAGATPFEHASYPTIASAPPVDSLSTDLQSVNLNSSTRPPPSAPPSAPPPPDEPFVYPNIAYPQLSKPAALPSTPFVPSARPAALPTANSSMRAAPSAPPPPLPPPPPPVPPPPSSSPPPQNDMERAIQMSLADQRGVNNKKATLARNLARKGFKEQQVPGDNNCQFHALSKQLAQHGQPGWNAMSIRRQIVTWLQNNTQNGGILMDTDGLGAPVTLREAAGIDNWREYCRTMSIHGVTWGDELTLIAASAIFRAEIVIISSVKEDACNEITPPAAWKVQIERRLIIGHYHEYHYTSVQPIR